MNIKKIQLEKNGFKGAKISYLREDEKNGRPVLNEILEKRKHPIHLGLEKMFKDLRPFLLDITGILRGDEDKNTKEYVIQESDVTGIEFDGLGFVLIGEKKIFDDKVIKLKTCKVEEEDDYLHFETIQNMIESIVEETKEYLAGTKVVDDVEVAVRWVQSGKAKGVTEEDLRGYSPEQLKEWATRLLENSFGAVVLMDSDMDLSNVDVTEFNEEIKSSKLSNIDIDEEIIISDEETIIPIPIKKDKKKSQEIKNSEKIVENIIKPAF